MLFNRQKAIAYAKEWAFARNPAYYNFDTVGGDCTNFVSQCLFAGGCLMNFTKDTGWYYRSSKDRAAAWTSVHYLHRFICNNKGIGPYGHVCEMNEAEIGDIIQLSFDGVQFTHSLLLTNKIQNEAFVSTHTYDAYNRPLNSYFYQKIRVIHIDGIRNQV